MKCKHYFIPAISAMIGAGLLINAHCVHAQGVRLGNRLIPRSSIEQPNDVGIRAHTHIQILIGPPGGQDGYFGGMGPGGGLTPAQLRQAYNLPSTGGGQIIAIVDAYDDPNALSNFNTFSAQYGLPQETSSTVTASTNRVFQVLYENGSKPPTDATGGWEMEESLDIEWAHAMAPNAKILLVEAASTSFGNLFAAEDAATKYADGNGLTVKQVSNSWGGSEFNGETTYDTHLSGSSACYFAAAGDAGAGAQYPSASPYAISAGGTTVTTNSSGNFVSEAGWSEGGGGPSAYEPRPAYQNGIASIVGVHRGSPDLSFDADPNTGVSVYDTYPYEGTSYTWIVLGGTSVASPSIAGIANLAASAAGSFPAGSQILLSSIYSHLGSADFRDITTGNNGYAAGVGWDFVTGVGTCLGLDGLQSSTQTGPTIASLSPNSATAGGAAFTLTVNGSGFVTGSVVDWNGSALTTTYVSATQVTASVPAADIASAGTASVTASNPGGLTSSAAAFTINSAGNAPVPTSVTLSPTSVTGGTSSTGTVTISSAAPTGGLTVNLSTTTPASVPATVTVAAGSTTATFTVTTSAVTTTATPSITATANGTSASGTLTVTAPNPVPTSVTLNPTSVIGGASSTGTVTISSAAPTGGLTVNLSTTTPASVPASVTVAAGSTTATFTVTTSAVTTTAAPSITATANGTSASGTLTVTAPNPVPTSVTLNPTSVIGGASSTGTVTISSAAPTGGLTVNLSTTTPASVPASVTVAAGSTTATFTVTTSAVTTTAAPSITATANGTSASGTLTVTPVTPPPPVFESSVYASPATLNLGSSTTVNATIYDASGSLVGGVVVCEIYDANGNQVQQWSVAGQSFTKGHESTYTFAWTPANRGTYTVKVGVYGANLTPLYYWSNNAATITVM